MDRREFMKGAALGVGAGVLGSMGLYSYSPLRRAFLPEVKRGTADIGVCKSVKVTNISETSWFDNGIFMNDGHVLQARGHRRHACRQQDRRLHPDP